MRRSHLLFEKARVALGIIRHSNHISAFVLIYTERQKIAFLRCVDLYKPSAQDVRREDNGDFQMQVIGSVFSGAGKDGDFDWMITQDHYEDALFVFNDNEAQYKAHRDRPTDLAGAGYAPGGGNAIIRPYQCKTPPRAVGIPTGPNCDSLTPEVKNSSTRPSPRSEALR
jgi:hypothetical protein